MGLRDAVQSAVKSAVAATGDIAVSTNYEVMASATYDASAGTYTAARSTVAGVSIIFDEFKIMEVDGETVKPEDKKALVPAKSISTVTPDVNDRIFESGVVWNVQGVRLDPAGALYELHVRKN